MLLCCCAQTGNRLVSSSQSWTDLYAEFRLAETVCLQRIPVLHEVGTANFLLVVQYLENNKHRYHAADAELAIRSLAEQLTGAQVAGLDPGFCPDWIPTRP